MITTALLLFFLYPLSFLTGALPTGSLPTGVSTAFSSILAYLGYADGLFPVDTLLLVLQYAIAFEVIVLTFKTGVWIYGRVRGVSSK